MKQFQVRYISQITRNGGVCLQAVAKDLETEQDVYIPKPLTISDEQFENDMRQETIFEADVDKCDIYLNGAPTQYRMMAPHLPKFVCPEDNDEG